MTDTRVLLVEDCPSDAQLVQTQLRSQGGFEVNHVRSLMDACESLHNGHRLDVVILDLNLPDSSGLPTFDDVHDRFPDIPIVILSGRDDDEMAEAAVARGAQDYVLKNNAAGDTLRRSVRYAIERNGRLLAERRNQIMERDIAVARQIQRKLLPLRPPERDGFDIAAVCQSAEECSGDFYDLIESKEDTTDLVVADVSSHGFGPALIMVGARRILRTCAPMYDDLGEILTIANRAVMEDTLEEQFVTLVFARLDTKARTLTYSAAGHPGFLIEADGTARELDYRGLPLGLVADEEYGIDGTLSLKTGDMVLLATDGAWEAHAPDGSQFGLRRMLDLLREHREKPAREILALLLEAIGRFRHPAVLDDDVTAALVKVTR